MSAGGVEDFDLDPSVESSSRSDEILAERVAEWGDRIASGESIDPETSAVDGFESPDAIRDLISTIGIMVRLGKNAGADPQAVTPRALSVLGKYRILRLLGRGGMGTVYEAERMTDGRRVALKVLPELSAADPARLKRFQAEAAAAASLSHPNIVPFYETGEHDGIYFFAMRLIEGSTLAERIDAAWLPEEKSKATTAESRSASFKSVANLIRQAADALQFAHEQGILHRDVKPSNLLLDVSGTLWVADFGTARKIGGTELTATGALIGTLRYMSPEQAFGDRAFVDRRADVYALGVTLYECLTLRQAFPGDDRIDLLKRIAFDDPIAPRRVKPDIPYALETIVLKAMAREPARRYASMRDFSNDLRRFADDAPPLARRPRAIERAAVWSSRHKPWIAWFSVVGLLLAFGLASGLLWRERILERHNSALRAALSVAERNERIQRRLWHGSQVRLAQQELSAGRVELAQEVLGQLGPVSGEEDLRGFEWRYLRDLARRDLSVLFGHNAPVSAVAVAPDGRSMISGDQDGWMILWDLAEGRERARSRPCLGQIYTLTYSHDGRRIASNSAGPANACEVKIWDATLSAPPILVSGITSAVRSISFSKNDATLIVRELSPALNLHWIAVTNGSESLRAIPAMTSRGVAISPDHAVLAVVDPTGRTTLREAATGRVIGTISTAFPTCVEVGFTPDGHCLVIQDKAGFHVLEIGTGEEIQRISVPSFEVPSLCFNSAYYHGPPISARGEGILPASCKERGSVVLQGFEPAQSQGFVFSANHRLLAGAGDQRVAVLWDTSSGKRVLETPYRAANYGSLAFGPLEKSLVIGGVDGRVRLPRIEPRKELPSKIDAHQAEAWALRYTPDGSTLISSGDDHLIKLWNAHDGTYRSSLVGHESLVASLAVSPDGLTLASAGFDRSVRLWDLSTGREPIVLQGHADRVRTAAFSPDGRMVGSGGSDGTVRLWDAHSGRSLAVLGGPPDPVHSIAFNRESTRLVAAGNDRAIHVWDLATFREERQIAATNSLTALVYSPDGTLLAAGDDMGGLTLWDVETWSRRSVIRGSEAPIWGLAFSPDNRTLAAACGDARVRTWDPTTGQLTLVLEGHRQRVNAVAFSPDGRTLSSTGHDGSIHLYRSKAD